MAKQEFVLLGNGETCKMSRGSLDTLSLLAKHPIAVPIQGISMRILTSPAEIIHDISNLGELRNTTIKGSNISKQD